MQADSVLLEPYYDFELKLDRQYIGRAMTDLERMGAAFTINDTGDEVSITGNGPVSCIGIIRQKLMPIQRELAA